jgi:hypothetical protein
VDGFGDVTNQIAIARADDDVVSVAATDDQASSKGNPVVCIGRFAVRMTPNEPSVHNQTGVLKVINIYVVVLLDGEHGVKVNMLHGILEERDHV